MRHRGQEGISLVWTALLLPVLIGMVGLAIDVGYMVWVAQQLQTAADAAALGCVRHVRHSEADTRAGAQLVAAENTAAGHAVSLDANASNAADGDIVIGSYTRSTQTFTPQSFGSCNAVRVVAHRDAANAHGPVQLLFGPAFGVDTADVSREAIAIIAGGTGDGLIVLNEHDPSSLVISGNASLTVNGGSIQVNSDNDQAAKLGAADIELSYDEWATDAASINIVGGAKLLGGGPDVPIVEGAPLIPDPLGFLEGSAEVDALRAMALGAPLYYDGSSTTLAPGYYPNGIQMSASGTVLNLLPGIYVLSGNGIKITGGILNAPGVMFFITGPNAQFDMSGGTSVTLTPYQSEGSVFDGISVFRDYRKAGDPVQPSNTINGTSAFTLDGTFYFPDSHVNLSGTNITVGSQLILNTATIIGNSVITINYEGKENAVGDKSFLVS